VPAPRVTIGMPVYNRAHLVGETIGYVLAQTFSDFELLVFDDGSADETVKIVQSITDARVRFLGSERLGPPHPLNKLMAEARGEYVIILHDHDIFDPTLIEKCVAALDKHPDAAFVLQGCAAIAEDGVSGYRENKMEWPSGLQDGRARAIGVLTKDSVFASPFHACSMVRMNALRAVGPTYDPSFGLHADVDLWFRLLARFDFVFLPEVLLRLRERPWKGHILESREFEINDVMRALFRCQADRFFEKDAPRRNAFLSQIDAIHARQERRLAMRAVMKRMKNARLGLARVADNPTQPLAFRYAARFLAPGSRELRA
jgi:glycosyltransferase involved in cell wall biosynthesis